MNSVARPRGPLPRRVYWTRRVLVFGVLALLLFGVTRLFGGSAPDTRPASAPVASPSAGLTPSATQSSAPVVAPPAVQTTPQARAQGGTQAGKAGKQGETTPAPSPLAVPTGPCSNGDVQVSPAVRRAYAGQPVTITLDLTTKSSPACTWEVSSQTVVVQLTSGIDTIWSSQDCPSALGQHSVIVRRDQPTEVQLVWKGQRSASGCRHTGWARQGWYHVEAAAYGAGPTDEQFHLVLKPRPTVYRTPKAQKKPAPATPTSSPVASGTAGTSPSASPSSSPTG